MMVYQAYCAQWLKKVLANGYVLICLVLASFVCMHFDLPDILSVLPFPLILLCGAYGSIGIDKFFAFKPLQRLGDWSFSIYLVHQPLILTLVSIRTYLNQMDHTNAAAGFPPKPDMFTGWLICLGLILVTLVVSYFTYRFIEVPARNRLNGKRKVVPQVKSLQS